MSLRPVCLSFLTFLPLLATPAPVLAQSPGVWWARGARPTESLPVVSHEGYAALAVSELPRFGWEVVPRGDSLDLVPARAEMDSVRLVIGTPFIRWAGEILQMTHPPYLLDGNYYVPAQLILDFLPLRAATVTYDPLTRTLSSLASEPPDAPETDLAEDSSNAARTYDLSRPRPYEERFVVVIDPGHGGRDPGTTGAKGVREKDVALALGLALAAELASDLSLEVHLTRDTDVLIPIWRRGEQATTWKSDRPGLFISIHANALPGSKATRGFETYVLSEARTDHERRVAAIENGDPRPDGRDVAGPEGEELDLILRELQNLGHQTWSALLAELVQEELEAVHTGRNRGVQQAPLAVITNALMPAVLVETGYLTNSRDEALLRSPAFHQDAARAMAHAVRRFFERYPPGERRTIPEER